MGAFKEGKAERKGRGHAKRISRDFIGPAKRDVEDLAQHHFERDQEGREHDQGAARPCQPEAEFAAAIQKRFQASSHLSDAKRAAGFRQAAPVIGSFGRGRHAQDFANGVVPVLGAFLAAAIGPAGQHHIGCNLVTQWPDLPADGSTSFIAPGSPMLHSPPVMQEIATSSSVAVSAHIRSVSASISVLNRGPADRRTSNSTCPCSSHQRPGPSRRAACRHGWRPAASWPYRPTWCR